MENKEKYIREVIVYDEEGFWEDMNKAKEITTDILEDDSFPAGSEIIFKHWVNDSINRAIDATLLSEPEKYKVNGTEDSILRKRNS